MHLNTTPSANRVNPSEARIVRRTFWTAYTPGACTCTLLAGIVATGALLGLDFTQEVAAIGPELKAAACCQPLHIAR